MADMLVEILGVTHSLLFLTDENEEKMHIKASRFLDPATTAPAMEITVTEKSADWLTSQNFESRALLSFDDEKFNEAFPDAAWIFQQQKIAVAIPMIYNYKLVGFLALGGKYMGESLQARDIDFLSTVAPMAASAISNVYLYEMAILDGLTKVFMGRYFRQRCREEVQRARRYKKILSIIMWDLDHFKDVNDTHGHLAGDAVLTEIATIFRKSLRQGIDMVARYGGEEFVMLLPDTPGDGAMIMAERLRRNISRQKFWDGKVQLTVSGGIASFPEDGTDYLTLIEQADIQLYRAKRDGRNRVRIRGLKRGPAPA
jgi:diguanylate cyclase (GGDEF)-like protein